MLRIARRTGAGNGYSAWARGVEIDVARAPSPACRDLYQRHIDPVRRSSAHDARDDHAGRSARVERVDPNFFRKFPELARELFGDGGGGSRRCVAVSISS